jgi:hypothetical protein
MDTKLPDPPTWLLAAVRQLQNVCFALYGLKRGIEVWERYSRYEPLSPPNPSFAGEHLNRAGHSALEICRIIKGAHPELTLTAIAREAARVLSARPPQREIVEVIWRAERMPPLADRETNTVTTTVAPDQLARLRQKIEAECGPISLWKKRVAQEADPATFDQDPERIDDALLRQLKRLLKRHELGHSISKPLSQTLS